MDANKKSYIFSNQQIKKKKKEPLEHNKRSIFDISEQVMGLKRRQSLIVSENSYKVPKLYNYEQDHSSDYSSNSEHSSQEREQDKISDSNKLAKTPEEQSEEEDVAAGDLSLKNDSGYGIRLEKFMMDKGSSEEEDESPRASGLKNNDAEKELYQEINNKATIQKAQELTFKEQNYLRERAKSKKNKRMQLNLQEALTQFSFFLLNDEDTIIQSFGKFNTLKKQLQKKTSEEVQYVVNAINYVTSLIDLAQSKGFEHNLYDIQLPQLLKCIDEETIDESETFVYGKTKLWSFKKIAANDKTQQKDHTTYEMDYWNQHYFKNKVVVKFSKMPDNASNWLHIQCINFARK